MNPNNNKYTLAILLTASVAMLMWSGTSVLNLGGFRQATAQTSNVSSTTGQTVEVTYLSTWTAPVSPTGNGTAVALCKKGDTVLNGGYQIGYQSVKSSLPSSVIVTATMPVIYENVTGKYEGWQASLVNTGADSLSIASHVLCAGIRIK